jgi:hypothetical protein
MKLPSVRLSPGLLRGLGVLFDPRWWCPTSQQRLFDTFERPWPLVPPLLLGGLLVLVPVPLLLPLPGGAALLRVLLWWFPPAVLLAGWTGALLLPAYVLVLAGPGLVLAGSVLGALGLLGGWTGLLLGLLQGWLPLLLLGLWFGERFRLALTLVTLHQGIVSEQRRFSRPFRWFLGSTRPGRGVVRWVVGPAVRLAAAAAVFGRRLQLLYLFLLPSGPVRGLGARLSLVCAVVAPDLGDRLRRRGLVAAVALVAGGRRLAVAVRLRMRSALRRALRSAGRGGLQLAVLPVFVSPSRPFAPLWRINNRLDSILPRPELGLTAQRINDYEWAFKQAVRVRSDPSQTPVPWDASCILNTFGRSPYDQRSDSLFFPSHLLVARPLFSAKGSGTGSVELAVNFFSSERNLPSDFTVGVVTDWDRMLLFKTRTGVRTVAGSPYQQFVLGPRPVDIVCGKTTGQLQGVSRTYIVRVVPDSTFEDPFSSERLFLRVSSSSKAEIDIVFQRWFWSQLGGTPQERERWSQLLEWGDSSCIDLSDPTFYGNLRSAAVRTPEVVVDAAHGRLQPSEVCRRFMDSDRRARLQDELASTRDLDRIRGGVDATLDSLDRIVDRLVAAGALPPDDSPPPSS